MWKRWFLFILFPVLAAKDTSENMDSKAISSAIAAFSAKFCNELEKDKSVVSSPLSAEFVLGLLTLGTTDPAHSELITALGVADDDSIRSTFSSVSSKLKAIKGVTLNVANKVYIQDGDYELQPQIKDDAVKVFDAAMEKLNFGDNVSAVKTINGWVESKTNQKIKDLLPEDSVDSSTRLVLVNALYFKGTWKDKFDPIATREQPFHINANTTVEIPMMYNEADYGFGFSETLQAQLLEIPYVGEEASMIVVLPQEIEGLNDVIAKLAAGHDLLADIENMYKTKVQVTLPKFKIETTIDLKELLPKLGINAIFHKENSGLTKLLNTDELLYVSKAVQKAFIEVNEEGAEAAAATGMVFMMRCMPPPTPAFRADRPYLYLLLGANKTPLFIGAYRNAA
ncbi:unnamed protein product [Arctia plantaginis]|uniref:Serpin domain-containing protein n=1 Tax=Arctia plantaginis TaxID=874455 RepID=A0A8S0ZWT9_ARCPL|nr:unnamed protein product [Arctia plantaginis]CAB3238472.1 unnamed protein product [Arctia plantaginis]